MAVSQLVHGLSGFLTFCLRRFHRQRLIGFGNLDLFKQRACQNSLFGSINRVLRSSKRRHHFTMMKIIQFKIKWVEIGAVVCLGCSLGLPAYAGKAEEGVDTLVNFTGKNGAQPQSILEDSAGNFYGTTLNGGKYNQGIVFEIEQNGKLDTLVDFNGANGSAPEAKLLLGPDGSLYGTTKTGGSSNKGTVFTISPKGKFSTLVSFNGANGSEPDSGLFLGPDGKIHGATMTGGAYDKGTVFSLVLDPVLVTVVTFDGKNGSNPGSLAQGDKGYYFGTTKGGGSTGKGTVFKIGPDGKLTTLVVFNGTNGSSPVSGIVWADDGNYYGTTTDGGKTNLGTVYKITPDGVLTTVVTFDGKNGSHPNSGLVEWVNGYFYMTSLWKNMLVRSAAAQWSGDNFCGTTSSGGAFGNGTVFKAGSDGNLITLVEFTGSQGLNLGATPNCLVAGDDGNLYGTTGFGGIDSQGTVFRLTLQLWLPPSGGESDGGQAGSFGFGPFPIVSK
jgi:uncharacterized repeat protein (TIGR03803 family)